MNIRRYVIVAFVILSSSLSLGAESLQMFHINEDKIFPIYASKPFNASDPNITKMVIVIHGTNRNALDYFHSAEEMLKSSNCNIGNTILISPKFYLENENHPNNCIVWRKNSHWKKGNKSTKNETFRVSSFQVIDDIILQAKENYQKLESVIILGHSAGGQFVQRYALGSVVDNGTVSIKYIVANPSSYAYLDNRRFISDKLIQPEVESSVEYNDWKYGLENINSYMGQRSINQIKVQYKDRDVVYLIGENDTEASATLDTTEAAMLQGSNRYIRGLNYYKYLSAFYDCEVHDLIIVDNVGHSYNQMFNSADCIELISNL